MQQPETDKLKDYFLHATPTSNYDEDETCHPLNKPNLSEFYKAARSSDVNTLLLPKPAPNEPPQPRWIFFLGRDKVDEKEQTSEEHGTLALGMAEHIQVDVCPGEENSLPAVNRHLRDLGFRVSNVLHESSPRLMQAPTYNRTAHTLDRLLKEGDIALVLENDYVLSIVKCLGCLNFRSTRVSEAGEIVTTEAEKHVARRRTEGSFVFELLFLSLKGGLECSFEFVIVPERDINNKVFSNSPDYVDMNDDVQRWYKRDPPQGEVLAIGETRDRLTLGTTFDYPALTKRIAFSIDPEEGSLSWIAGDEVPIPAHRNQVQKFLAKLSEKKILLPECYPLAQMVNRVRLALDKAIDPSISIVFVATDTEERIPLPPKEENAPIVVTVPCFVGDPGKTMKPLEGLFLVEVENGTHVLVRWIPHEADVRGMLRCREKYVILHPGDNIAQKMMDAHLLHLPLLETKHICSNCGQRRRSVIRSEVENSACLPCVMLHPSEKTVDEHEEEFRNSLDSIRCEHVKTFGRQDIRDFSAELFAVQTGS